MNKGVEVKGEEEEEGGGDGDESMGDDCRAGKAGLYEEEKGIIIDEEEVAGDGCWW